MKLTKRLITLMLIAIIALAPMTEAMAIIWSLPTWSWHSHMVTVTVLHIDPGAGVSDPSPRLRESKLTLVAGRKHTLKMDGVNPKKVTWSSSNKKVATVNKKGKVKALKPGKTTITVHYGKKTSKCRVTVKKKVFAKNIKLTEIPQILLVGETPYVQYKVSPSDKKITEPYSLKWATSDPSVVTVDKEGKITVVGQGSATVSALMEIKKGKTKTVSIPVQTETGLTRITNWINSHGGYFADGGNSVELRDGKWIFTANNMNDSTPWITTLTVNYDFTGNAELTCLQYWRTGFKPGVVCFEGTAVADFRSMYNHTKHEWNFTTLDTSKYNAKDWANADMAVMLSSFEILLRDNARLRWANLGMPYNDY